MRRLGLCAVLGVATAVALVATATSAGAAPKAQPLVPPATVDTAAAMADHSPIKIATSCTLDPGTAARDGAQVSTNGSVTCVFSPRAREAPQRLA
jgi:hypothetical protein